MDASPPQKLVVLFLDFDGVLHGAGEAALDNFGRLIPNPALFRWRALLEQLLAPHPALRIIVSSDWRCHFDDENLARLLGPSLGQRMIGVVENYDQSSRAIEILVEAERRGIERWLAVDDHATTVEARKAGDKRFIVCHPETGLSAPKVQKELRAGLAKLCGSAQTANSASRARAGGE